MRKSSDWPDEQIIAFLSQGGDLREQATYHLMDRFINFVPAVAKKTGLTQDAALDVFTDAILALIDQVKNGAFKGESKLSSYLYKIFYHKSIDLFRKNSTNRISYQENIPDLPDGNHDTIFNMETKEEVKQLLQYFEVLGEPCKQILLDWGFWGYRMSEIAVRAGLKNSDQAKDKKYKCLQKLRNIMRRF